MAEEPIDSLDLWVLESKYFVRVNEKLAALPANPGAYLMKNERGEIIYVGKAVSLKNRVKSYFQKHGRDVSGKTRRLVDEIADIDWIVTDTELEALILECTLIKRYRPYYNVLIGQRRRYNFLPFDYLLHRRNLVAQPRCLFVKHLFGCIRHLDLKLFQ